MLPTTYHPKLQLDYSKTMFYHRALFDLGIKSLPWISVGTYNN